MWSLQKYGVSNSSWRGSPARRGRPPREQFFGARDIGVAIPTAGHLRGRYRYLLMRVRIMLPAARRFVAESRTIRRGG